MTEFLNALLRLDAMAIVQAGGYVGITFLVFAESGLIIGLFFPGDSVLFIAGLLAATGLLSSPLLISLIVAAAIAGDSIGYWFGKKAGDRFFSREESRFCKKEYVDRAQRFFQRYGGRAIILARFVPIVRTLIPILAGIGTMNYRRFLSYNIIGGVFWGAGIVSLGYFLGSVIPDSEKYILPLVGTIIILSFIPIIIEVILERRLH